MIHSLVAAVVAGPAWTLVLGGDVMLNGIAPASDPLGQVAVELAAADLTMANLEIPLTNRGEPTSRKSQAEIKERSQFVLRADPGHAASLASSGIDMVSLGNNHAMDFGELGLEQMTQTLAGHDLLFAGAGSDSYRAFKPAVYITGSGFRVSLVSALAFMSTEALWRCTPATARSAGVAALDLGGAIGATDRKKLRQIVSRAKRVSDFVIVGLHWGIEKAPEPSSYQVELGRALIDAGADLVWGHHPHVLQGAELYRGKPILYSAGNLIASRPGETALFRLEFEGRRIRRFETVPCRIQGGAVSPLPPDGYEKARSAFHGLSMALSRSFRNQNAVPLG